MKKQILSAVISVALMMGIATIVHASIVNPSQSGGGSGGSVSTGTVATLGSPLTLGGNASATIFGVASNNSTNNTSYIPQLDGVYTVPLDYATNGCNGSSTLTDFGGCVNSLYANAPSNPYYIGINLPCNLSVPSSTWKTPIMFANFGVRPSLFSNCGVILHWGGQAVTSTSAITWNFENPTGHLDSQDYGFLVQQKDSLISAGQANTATSTGLMCGGNYGCVGVHFHDISVNGFGRNIATGANAYMDSWQNVVSSGGDCGTSGLTGCLFYVPGASNSGESFALTQFFATDPANTSTNAIYLTNASVASFSWCGGSLDDAQFFFGASNGSVSLPCLLHVENSDHSQYPNYTPFQGVSSDLSTSLVINDLEVANDGTSDGFTGTLIQHGGQLSIQFLHLDNYGGGTVGSIDDHSLDNGLSADHICGVAVQSGTLTNIVAGSGGATYNQARGVGCSLNVANSYTIDIYPNGSNTNNIDSGNSTVATFDHLGNWTFAGTINASSSITAQGTITARGNINVNSGGTIDFNGAAVTDAGGDWTGNVIQSAANSLISQNPTSTTAIGNFVQGGGVQAPITASTTVTGAQFCGGGYIPVVATTSLTITLPTMSTLASSTLTPCASSIWSGNFAQQFIYNSSTSGVTVSQATNGANENIYYTPGTATTLQPGQTWDVIGQFTSTSTQLGATATGTQLAVYVTEMQTSTPLTVNGNTVTVSTGLSIGTTTVPLTGQLIAPSISSTAITIGSNSAAIVPSSVVTGYMPTGTFWNNTTNTGTSTLNLSAIQVPYTTTFTGIGFAIWDISTGSTTVGIYNSAGTLLASSTILAISGTFATITQPFQHPYTASPGVYYLALLNSNASTHFVGNVDFAKTAATSTSNGLIPATFNTAILTGNGITPAMATY